MSVQVKESYLWQQVKQGLEDDQTHLSRIENTAGTGISDITACNGGVEVWIELKVFHGNRLHFRNSQKIWILKRTEVGGRVLVIARKDATIFLYDAKEVMRCKHEATSDWKSFTIKMEELPIPLFTGNKPFKWKDIRCTVFGHT
jgi:hypothetical protein